MSNGFVIRNYNINDAAEVGILIADTYRKYNLAHVPIDEIQKYMSGFFYCRSNKREHRNSIISLLHAPMVYVVVTDGIIAGVLRGSPGRLHSLFVREDFHRRGVGSMLMKHFETECIKKDCRKITLAASMYAVPFYISMGYKKSTGIRKSHSFEGTDFHIQPMKKLII